MCQLFNVLWQRPQDQRPNFIAFIWQLMDQIIRVFSIYSHVKHILHSTDTTSQPQCVYVMYKSCFFFFKKSPKKEKFCWEFFRYMYHLSMLHKAALLQNGNYFEFTLFKKVYFLHQGILQTFFKSDLKNRLTFSWSTNSIFKLPTYIFCF